MKREKNNNLVNQNLIEMMEESTTSKNIQGTVNPCGCIYIYIYIYTFSLNEYKNNQLNLIDRNAKFFKHTEDANIVNNSSNLNNSNNSNNHKASSHNLWTLLSSVK